MHDYFDASWMQVWAAIGGTLVTALSVFVAIEKEFFRRRLFPPGFAFIFKYETPYVDWSPGRTPTKLERRYGLGKIPKVHNYRIRLLNESSHSAENVEVFLDRICRFEDGISKEDLASVPPLRLKFSYSGDTQLRSLPSNASAYIDIGEVFEETPLTIEQLLRLESSPMRLPLEHELATGANWLTFGTYRLVLSVRCDNGQPESHTIEVDVRGGWADQFPEEGAGKEVLVRVVPR